MKRWKWMGFLLLCLMAFLLAGCKEDPQEDTSTEVESTASQDDTEEAFDDITLEGMAGEVIEKMSLDEKIGQLFFVCTDAMDFYAETEITDQMKENLAKYQPGGIVFFSFNLENRYQTSFFINEMQSQVKIPMFMGVDEEGGTVARIANHDEMGTTRFPTMKEIGETQGTEYARQMGQTIGLDISRLGFNTDFAPVADIMTNEDNSEIGERSFGADANLVADLSVNVLQGLQDDSSVCATMKHFPGQGSSSDDTHKGFVDLSVTIDDLRKNEFLPFKKGIKAGVDFIMMSHVALSSVTGNDLPASLSSIMVSDILRSELKYDGIIITDAMNMKSITKFFDSDEAAVKAFRAGNDMILMPDDFELAYEGIKDAVDRGKIKEEEIDAAVMRILKTKIKRGIISKNSAYFQ